MQSDCRAPTAVSTSVVVAVATNVVVSNGTHNTRYGTRAHAHVSRAYPCMSLFKLQFVNPPFPVGAAVGRVYFVPFGEKVKRVGQVLLSLSPIRPPPSLHL